MSPGQFGFDGVNFDLHMRRLWVGGWFGLDEQPKRARGCLVRELSYLVALITATIISCCFSLRLIVDWSGHPLDKQRFKQVGGALLGAESPFYLSPSPLTFSFSNLSLPFVKSSPRELLILCSAVSHFLPLVAKPPSVPPYSHPKLLNRPIVHCSTLSARTSHRTPSIPAAGI
ncbi:hypothetical protein F5144DRAFT_402719 [Chaetomium tenue]|uniref:Uncharacterized protein n=1 Tax=Chaetomium tenue TaxID=1854479 RepID=A0ACB7NVT9_9PEZI|nr:hypothetical protein F5144DRAFT_402719 [Chaetomium globosum]